MDKIEYINRDYGIHPNINYFLDWRPYLWRPVVRWLIQDPSRFVGKRVLELGCQSGKMSCYFGLLGASVTGVDLLNVDLGNARSEALKWNLQKSVDFRNYDGNPRILEKNEYDFIFTKSVFVIIPQLPDFLKTLTTSMKIGCEIIAAENSQTNWFTNSAITFITGNTWRQNKRYKGVNDIFLGLFKNIFGNVDHKEFYGLITGIRSTRIE